MTWLGGRMKWPFGSNGAAVAELEPEPEIEVVDDSKPHLMMLAADASGLASFKLLSFPTAETAVEFIQRSFGDRSDTGLIAFWAMTEKPVVSPQPGADTALEVMVMIRDDMRNDVVYPFSFTDMNTAHGFVQHELQRGLDPNHVLLYWAVPVQLGISANGEVGLFPKAAPTEVDQETQKVTYAAIDEPAPEASGPGGFMQSLSVSAAVDEPFVATEDDPIEAMLASAEEPIVEPVTGSADVVEEDIEDCAGGGDEAQLEETEEAFAEEAEMTEEATEDESQVDVVVVAEDAEVAEEASEDESELDVAVVAEDVDVEAAEIVEDEAAEEPASETVAEEETVEETIEDRNETAETSGSAEALEETQVPVAAIASQRWVSDGPMGTEFAAGRAYAKSEASINDVSDQLQRVLKVRRWEESTEPFRGFQSPPGRF